MKHTSDNLEPSGLLLQLRDIYQTLGADVIRCPAGRRLIEGRFDRRTYVELLCQSYHYVRRTRPWLARAAERCADPRLARALRQKAAEETGHEKWILSDLDALGVDVGAPDRWPVCAGVRAYVAWHDFAVEGEHPEAILGAAYILERLSEDHASRLANHAVDGGFGPEATRFMSGHGEADVDHMRELRALFIEVRAARPRSQIVLSARITAASYIGLLGSLPA